MHLGYWLNARLLACSASLSEYKSYIGNSIADEGAGKRNSSQLNSFMIISRITARIVGEQDPFAKTLMTRRELLQYTTL